MLRIRKAPKRLSAYTNEDSEGNPMVKDHAYKAQRDGQVFVYSGNFSAQGTIQLFVGLTSNPAGAGERIQYQSGSEIATYQSVSAEVAKGEFFEVTATASAGSQVIRWKTRGRMKKPVDFN